MFTESETHAHRDIPIPNGTAQSTRPAHGNATQRALSYCLPAAGARGPNLSRRGRCSTMVPPCRRRVCVDRAGPLGLDRSKIDVGEAARVNAPGTVPGFALLIPNLFGHLHDFFTFDRVSDVETTLPTEFLY